MTWIAGAWMQRAAGERNLGEDYFERRNEMSRELIKAVVKYHHGFQQ